MDNSKEGTGRTYLASSWSTGVVGIRFGLIAAGLYVGVVTFCRLPLLWDGSYYLFRILDDGRPFVVFGRWPVLVLQLPVVAFGHLIGVAASTYLFSFCYSLGPLVAIGLAVSWFRSDPEARSWCIVGISLFTLPGIFFFASEAILATQLWWPLVILAARGKICERRWSAASVVVVLLFLHPASVVLLLALAAVVIGVSGAARGAVVLAAVLTFVSVIRYSLISPYETSSVPSGAGMVYLGGGVQTIAYAFSIAGLLVAVFAVRDSITMRHLWLSTSWLCFTAAAVGYLYAATVPTKLDGLASRSSLPLVVVPVALLLAWHLGRNTAADRLESFFSKLVTLSILLTLALLLLGGITWLSLQKQALSIVLSYQEDCIPLSALSIAEGTPLGHWSTSTLSILEQGQRPSKIVLDYGGCGAVESASSLRLVGGDIGGPRPRELGWFDLRSVGK